jgi:hypothetical protein
MTHTPPIRITVALAASEYRPYVRAAQILARVMGRRAPTVGALIQAQLLGRDAPGVADDYLDWIEWPSEKGRVISLRQPRLKTRRANLRAASPTRPRQMDAVSPVDPSRN